LACRSLGPASQRGAKVRVIDPYGPGAGSSGGIVGALAPHVPEKWNDKKAFQLDSLLMAADFWSGVEESSGLSTGYARSGRLQPIADAAGLDLARARALSAASLWQGLATWEVVRADSLDGWKPRQPKRLADPRYADGAFASAQGLCGACCGACVQRRAGWADGPMEGAVIHATGVAGLSALNAALTRSFGNGVKGQAALLSLDMRDAPQLFVDTVHIIPHADGTVAIGSTSERDYDDPASTDDQLEQLIDARPRRGACLARCASDRALGRGAAPVT
jgi:glycine oxidase